MTVVTSRADFEKLIVLRMEEAKLLIEQKQDWDGISTWPAMRWSLPSKS